MRHSVWDEKTQQKWNALLVKQAKEYRIKAVELGGVLIKVGQFLSTRTDFMPDVFIRELTGLVDRVPPMTFDYAKRLLEEEWGGEIGDYVAEINETSIASASIGEVYRAKLSGGTEVAIKVQRYRVQQIFQMDFKALRMVFWILSVFTGFGKKADLKALYRELITVMDRELNFHKELEYGTYFKERYKDNSSIHIPNYYEKLSTKKVLVMDWVDGAKITDLEFMNRHQINIQQTAKTLFDFYIDQFLNQGKFHADPHAGNIIIQKDGMISIIDFGMIGEVGKQDTHYFKRIIKSLIMDDYDRIVETLDEMNFILPNADKSKLNRMIKQTIELYRNGSFKNIDAHVMDQLRNDIRIFIKDQPIQLSAEYAYLGRAISIVFGILFAIYPDIDIERWAKPKIKKMFGDRSLVESIYKQYAKDAAEPILSLPKAMLNWLESGERDRQWDKEKQEKQWKQNFYLLLEAVSFIMVIVGIAFSFYGFNLGMSILTISAIAVTVFFILIMNTILLKHYRMIRKKT
ncbi:AarF/UbiB family protein [Virgibacillus sp. C22-A2]|uniref:AarF/UbiB family protein n=2 Tax=Virgibacillus tibetensis TaxID=3042313 RepID=A0ABU6KGI9_9BACI|nr:AarF/UbiB family protein [Virgibacillus sp. C22-A2]